MWSELGKLMWLARIARPDAIYDAPAAAQNFPNFKPENCDGETSFKENEEEMMMLIILNRVISNTFLDSEILWQINREMRIRWICLRNKEIRYIENAFRGSKLNIFEESNKEIKRGWKYRIKFPSADWAEEDIGIEVHCDADQISTKSGSRAQLRICGFIRNKITEGQKRELSYRYSNLVA